MSAEHQNHVNMVSYYAPELHRVIRGEPAVEVFPMYRQRRRLLQQGILEIHNRGGKSGKQIKVSPSASQALEEDTDYTP